MLRNPVFSVTIASAYLGAYCLFFAMGFENTVAVMFFFSPVLVAWMVITILKYGKFKNSELKDDEEWGYADRSREELSYDQ